MVRTSIGPGRVLVLSAALAACRSDLSGRPPADEGLAAGPVYAALPLRNATASSGVAERLSDLVVTELERRGALFLDERVLERFLRDRRIRYTDSVSSADAAALAEQFGVEFVLAGALQEHVEAPLPQLSATLRTVDTATGLRIGSASVAMRGDDTEGLLGLGRIEDVDVLLLEVAARLLDGFDASGRPLSRDALARPGSEGVDAGFVAEDFDPARIGRITVLPPRNRSGRPEATGLLAEQFAHHWFRTAGVDVVELSELRGALVGARVRSMDRVDPEVLASVSSRLGTRYVSLGSVDRFSAETFTDHGIFPEVELSLEVVDVERRRVVAAASVRRRGDDYHLVLGLGNVEDLETLSSLAVRDLVAAVVRRP